MERPVGVDHERRHRSGSGVGQFDSHWLVHVEDRARPPGDLEAHAEREQRDLTEVDVRVRVRELPDGDGHRERVELVVVGDHQLDRVAGLGVAAVQAEARGGPGADRLRGPGPAGPLIAGGEGEPVGVGVDDRPDRDGQDVAALEAETQPRGVRLGSAVGGQRTRLDRGRESLRMTVGRGEREGIAAGAGKRTANDPSGFKVGATATPERSLRTESVIGDSRSMTAPLPAGQGQVAARVAGDGEPLRVDGRARLVAGLDADLCRCGAREGVSIGRFQAHRLARGAWNRHSRERAGGGDGDRDPRPGLIDQRRRGDPVRVGHRAGLPADPERAVVGGDGDARCIDRRARSVRSGERRARLDRDVSRLEPVLDHGLCQALHGDGFEAIHALPAVAGSGVDLFAVVRRQGHGPVRDRRDPPRALDLAIGCRHLDPVPDEVRRDRHTTVRDQHRPTTAVQRNTAPERRQLRALTNHVRVVHDEVAVDSRGTLEVDRPRATLRVSIPCRCRHIAQDRPHRRPVFDRNRPATSTPSRVAPSLATASRLDHPIPTYRTCHNPHRPPGPSTRIVPRHLPAVRPNRTLHHQRPTHPQPHNPAAPHARTRILTTTTRLLREVHTPKRRRRRGRQHPTNPQVTPTRVRPRCHRPRIRHTPRVPATGYVNRATRLDRESTRHLDLQALR